MPFQNRVDPFSRIHAVSMRGLFTGNRGILHDAQTRTLKKQSWATDGWVMCVLEFKGRRAPIMGRSHWTELFFLDEAVGLAAGHRPCFECQRARASAFRDACGASSAKAIHTAVNNEMKPRLRVRDPEARPSCNPAELPDGAMFAVGATAFLKHERQARRFTWAGYGPPEALPDEAFQLTQTLSILALKQGYKPSLHPSVGD